MHQASVQSRLIVNNELVCTCIPFHVPRWPRLIVRRLFGGGWGWGGGGWEGLDETNLTGSKDWLQPIRLKTWVSETGHTARDTEIILMLVICLNLQQRRKRWPLVYVARLPWRCGGGQVSRPVWHSHQKSCHRNWPLSFLDIRWGLVFLWKQCLWTAGSDYRGQGPGLRSCTVVWIIR